MAVSPAAMACIKSGGLWDGTKCVSSDELLSNLGYNTNVPNTVPKLGNGTCPPGYGVAAYFMLR